MQVNTRAVMERCIENGIQAGLRRAFKHTDTPSQEVIAESIDRYIWLELDDMFRFPEYVHNDEQLVSNDG